jgi:predicted ATPase
MRLRAIVATAVLGALLVGGSAMPALARDGDVIRRGACTGATDWKLKLSEENGRIEVEYEVDQNRVGDAWRVRIRHDGDLVFAGTRTTRGASGSFEVRIVQANRSGDDVFTGRAVNLRTGEVCGGRAVWTA